jgi:hypothetical protein
MTIAYDNPDDNTKWPQPQMTISSDTNPRWQHQVITILDDKPDDYINDNTKWQQWRMTTYRKKTKWQQSQMTAWLVQPDFNLRCTLMTTQITPLMKHEVTTISEGENLEDHFEMKA